MNKNQEKLKNLKYCLSTFLVGPSLQGNLNNPLKTLSKGDSGTVKSAIEGVVFINLHPSSNIFVGEIIDCVAAQNKIVKGMVIGLSAGSAEIMVFGDSTDVFPGDLWKRTKEIANVGCGPRLLGRVIDCIGNAIDGPTPSVKVYNIFAKVPGVCARERVGQALFTGILSVDSLIPVGKGQRELIIGDRKTGKSSIASESIINQQYTLCETCFGYNGTYCFYVAIGQKLSSLRKLIYRFKKQQALGYTTIIVADASDAAGAQYLAPYTGCTLGE
jgi:F0F1-type ATP synthase alpha subunit